MNESSIFVKVRVDGRNIWWFELVGDILINLAGGRWTFDSSRHQIIDAVIAEYFRDLDWTGTVFDDPDSPEGWLTPDGKFYGCSYGSHDMSAKYMLKRNHDDLIASGYGRVHAKNTFTGRPFVYFGSNVQPTDAQKLWMNERGID